MAWCLRAPSHDLNLCWLSSARSCGIHLREISQKMPKNVQCYIEVFCDICLFQTVVRFGFISITLINVLEDKYLLYSYLFNTQFQLPLLTSLLQFDMNLNHLLCDLYHMDVLVTSGIHRKLYHKCFYLKTLYWMLQRPLHELLISNNKENIKASHCWTFDWKRLVIIFAILPPKEQTNLISKYL